MTIELLREEITTDPLGRGYSGMTDLDVADSLNVVNREMDVDMVSGQDIFEAVVPSEFTPLSADQKSLFYAIIGMGSVMVNGTNTRTALLDMFGAGTTTRNNLAVLQKRDVSRAGELGISFVYEGHVQEARNG